MIASFFAVHAQKVQAADSLDLGPPALFKIEELGSVITAGVSLLFIVAAILAFLYLILGGIQWITSGGDKSAMEAARNKITHAVVGLIVVGAAYAIILLVQSFLGVNIFGGALTIPTPTHTGSDF